jgi:hypothetical protein
MKKSVLFVLLMMAISISASGQVDSAVVKLYDSWYFFNSGLKSKVKVFTYDFQDSTITIVARNGYFRNSVPASSDLQIIPVQNINKIVFRRKGQQTAFLVGGLVTGALFGAIIGYSNGDDPYDNSLGVGVSAGVKAFTGAMLGAGIGVGIGLTLGSIKKTIPLDSNVERYKKMKPTLLKYSIRYYNHKTPLIMN